MPKSTIKKIQLDRPNERVAENKERIQALEIGLKKIDPTFEKPESEIRK
jgi:hypothetical protein